MSHELHHSHLGLIRGKAAGKVVQYLGLKYAILKDRFAPPELCTKYDDNVFDATEFGPSVVSPPSACDMEQSLIQHALPHEKFSISDVDGLNLNVTVPAGSHGNLPVFVFIHGGGFRIGSNSWPQYDFARIVKLSAEKGMPVIGVSINYRLGVLGFLTSNELRNAGYKANNGIWDQRTALLWIKRNISGFGGNAENVTVIGESAGGVSCTLHLHSTEPLFNRIVSMAGTSLLMKPLPSFVGESTYLAVLRALGLEHLSPADRISAMLSLPIDDFYSKITPAFPLIPVIEDDLVPGTVSFDQISTSGSDVALPGKTWCESLLIGDCKFDGNIFSLIFSERKAGISKSFVESLSSTLREYPGAADLVSQAYGLSPDTADDAGLVRILRFASDIGFYAPVTAFAKGWPGSKRAYVYHFNEPNPWDGPWKGEPTHILDVAFLFQNYNEYLSAEQRVVAESFAEHLILFVNGRAPFPAFSSGKGGAMVYGPPTSGSAFIESLVPEDVGRSGAISRFAQRIGLDVLSSVWNNFMTGH